MKTDPIKKSDLAFAGQLITCKTNLPTYAAVLKLTADQVASQADDADAMDYWVKATNIIHRDSVQFTTWRNLMRDGGSPGMNQEPGVPVLPPAVKAVLPGIESRHRALIQIVTNSASYNDAIGAALDMVGAVVTPPDLSTLLPLLTLQMNGNRVEIGWGWQSYKAYLDQLEIQVDRADGKGYVLLTYDPTPDYIDPTPLPTAPAKWTYRGIYRVGEVQVGQWSSPVSIMVGV